MRRTAEEAAETREAIVDAALQAFAEKGWSATTLDEVARRAGVTRGAVYHHARDKASLLIMVLTENWSSAMVPAWQRLAAPGQGPVERLAGFLAEFLRLLAEDDRFRALSIVTVTVAPQLPPETADPAQQDRQDVLTSWRTALRSVVTEIGDPVPSGLGADDVAFALMSVVYGATTLAVRPPLLPSATDPALAGALVRGLLDHGSA